MAPASNRDEGEVVATRRFEDGRVATDLQGVLAFRLQRVHPWVPGVDDWESHAGGPGKVVRVPAVGARGTGSTYLTPYKI